MGIFDYFKKKNKDDAKIQNSDLNNIVPKENKPRPNSGKSLNDMYAQKKQKDISKKPEINENGIEMLLDDQGSHGDNFGSLFGFDFLHSPKGNQLVTQLIALSSTKNAVLENPIVSIKETDFKDINGNSDLLRLRSIVAREQTLSAYPYLKTNYILPFQTKKITEWSHVAKTEAEIQGGGRETFGLAFFATDYAVNKHKYKTEKNINVRISAFGLVLDKSDLTEINGTKVSPDFATYMPSKDIPRPTYYDFIGVLNSFSECKISNEVSGYIINIKLINQENEPDFFTVDMFINKENMRFNELTKGMKISGALWLQGEIA